MNYYTRIQKTIDYIDAHTNECITLEVLSEIAFLSKYYYHRLFSALVGESVMSYIRKQRLRRAVCQLNETSLRIIDIALDNGFESQEVFIRAFTKYFEITPAKYRKLQSKIGLSDKISILGMTSTASKSGIQPKIVAQKAILGIGMKFLTTYEENLKKATISQFHEVFKSKLHEIKGCINPQRLYGICEEDPPKDSLYHTVFSEVTSHYDVPKGMEAYHFNASRYLVFSHKGPIQEIVDTYHYIYHDWLPNSVYELSKTGRDLQIYDQGKFDGFTVDMDICVPID